MNLEQVGIVLAKAASVDNRDVGRAAVLAWNEIIGPLDLGDALAAVTRFRIESPGVYLEPGHVRRIARIIREDRERSAVTRALPPGVFESDPERVERTKRNAGRLRQLLTELAVKRAIPEPDGTTRPPTRSEVIHSRALDRAQREKRLTRP